MKTSLPLKQVKLNTIAKVFGVIVFILLLSSQISYSQTSTCEYPACNKDECLWSPECYFNDDCTVKARPCTSSDVTITRVYIADSLGNPIAPFCPSPGDADLYLWAEFDANAERYAVRTYFELYINGLYDTSYNVGTTNIIYRGIYSLPLISEPIIIDCDNEYSISNVWIAWATTESSTLDNTTTCVDYISSKCSKNTAESFTIIVPSITQACTGVYSEDSIEVSFTGSASGGIEPYTYEWDFDGDGVTDTTGAYVTWTFDTSGGGDFTVLLTVTDSNGDYGKVEADLTLPTVSCPGDMFLCDNESSFTLTGATVSPDGGSGTYYYDSYIGEGESAYTPGEAMTDFDPTSAGIGTHTLSYTYTVYDTTGYPGCTAICYFDITVYEAPEVTCPNDTFLLQQDDAITLADLPGLNPAGGIFTIQPDTITVFDPAGYEKGIYKIMYKYTDPITGCSDSCYFDIEVEVCSLDLDCPGTTVTVACPSEIPEAFALRATTVEELTGLGFTVNDYCESLSIESTVGTVPECEGDVTVTYTITDAEDNWEDCNVIYTIDRTIAPAEVGGPVATSTTVECPADVVAPTLPVVEDYCGT
ncbi:MAG: hypothetical protein GX796_07150, partial [Clostridiaceae bacterium]|nr:hypothetical protein [Clostridiaceae bacterium]